MLFAVTIVKIVLIPVFEVTGDCLPYLLLLRNPACITQINSSVLIHVVHAAGCCWSIVVVHGSTIYSLIIIFVCC